MTNESIFLNNRKAHAEKSKIESILDIRISDTMLDKLKVDFKHFCENVDLYKDNALVILIVRQYIFDYIDELDCITLFDVDNAFEVCHQSTADIHNNDLETYSDFAELVRDFRRLIEANHYLVSKHEINYINDIECENECKLLTNAIEKLIECEDIFHRLFNI